MFDFNFNDTFMVIFCFCSITLATLSSLYFWRSNKKIKYYENLAKEYGKKLQFLESCIRQQEINVGLLKMIIDDIDVMRSTINDNTRTILKLNDILIKIQDNRSE